MAYLDFSPISNSPIKPDLGVGPSAFQGETLTCANGQTKNRRQDRRPAAPFDGGHS